MTQHTASFVYFSAGRILSRGAQSFKFANIFNFIYSFTGSSFLSGHIRMVYDRCSDFLILQQLLLLL